MKIIKPIVLNFFAFPFGIGMVVLVHVAIYGNMPITEVPMWMRVVAFFSFFLGFISFLAISPERKSQQ